MFQNIIEVLILSAIQGISEFLPVSSSAHLILVSSLYEFKSSSLLIDISLHLGSLIAIIYYFKEELLNINKNKSKFVAVLVKPNNKILEELKSLPFDYYQLYDCTPEETKIIKQKYQKKIITALTIKDKFDVDKYKSFSDVADIYLFDSKGYEESQGFDHNLIKNIKFNKELMLAGNIKFDNNLKNYEKFADFIDLSGGLETSGLKDTSKIEIFLNNLNKIKNET
jgi:phosphoribosylanthranilate isomerase